MTSFPSPPQRTTSRLQIFVWTLFDFANTSFSVIIIAVGYSLYFKDIVAGGKGMGDLLWGIAVSVSMFITAAIAPVLGAAADFSSRRKRFLFGFTIVSVACTSLLYFIGEGMIAAGMTLFIIANIGFEGGIVFYDAFLPNITTERSYGRVSGYGYAMGYFGSLTTLLFVMPLYAEGFVPSNLGNVRLSFVLAALIFLAFSAPLFLFFRDHKVKFEKKPSYIRAGWERVRQTISHLKDYRQVARFLLAFFIYNDGILTVISFASIFAKQSLNFSLREIIALFAVVQASGVVGSLMFGVVTDKIGPKKTIDINLVLWLVVVTAAYFVQSKVMFFGISIIAGSSLGAAQSASRSLMALLTPKEREAEFFGFYDGLCGKASAVIGTFLFGLISYLTNNQRLSILSVGAFFILGLALLQRVDDTRAGRAAS
ncbi:MAG TPA: MFS transporter [Bacteroidota bacterium]|nr:MFS transporter [Bacteroidota bacterium]